MADARLEELERRRQLAALNPFAEMEAARAADAAIPAADGAQSILGRFFLGTKQDAPIEPGLIERAQGLEPARYNELMQASPEYGGGGVMERPKLLPWTTDPNTGESRFAMPKALDLMPPVGRVATGPAQAAARAAPVTRETLARTLSDAPPVTNRLQVGGQQNIIARPPMPETPPANANEFLRMIQGGPTEDIALLAKVGKGRAATLAAEAQRRARAAETAPPAIGHNQPPTEAKFSQWKDEYPPYGGHTWEIKTPFTKDKDVKAELAKVPQAERALDEKHFFPSKQLSPEGAALDKERRKIQIEINKGNYTPYFDVSKRADVDPANYPAPPVDTAQIKPVTADAQKRWSDKLVDNPEAMSRLKAAYEAGKKLPNAKNWYFMKQLEDKFVKEFGEVEGRSRFADKFAGSMAATTGGASPDSNWLMAHFINYLDNKGKDLPKQSYETPVGVGGRYGVSSWTPGPYGRDNPKRLNFQYDFLGHKNKATMDEQMSQGLIPGTNVPPHGTYGHFEEAAIKLAKDLGIDPRELQETAWAGFKATSGKKGAEKYTGEPMIQTLNESIERTARLTGRTPDEVVRLGVVRGEIPMYSVAPAAGAAGLAGMQALTPEEKKRAEDLISGRL